MKKRAKIIIMVIIIIAVLGFVAVSYMTPMDVATVRLEPKEAYAYFIETGTVTQGGDFSLYPEVSGTVLETLVKKGDFVNAGDVIVIIDSTDYKRQKSLHEANISGYKAQIVSAYETERNTKDDYKAAINTLEYQLSQIEAQRKSAEASRLAEPSVSEQLNLLQVTIDKLKADAALAGENADRLMRLYEAGAVSKADLDAAQSTLDDTLSALKQYETEYEQTSGKAGAADLARKGEEELFSSQKGATSEQIAALYKNIQKSYSEAAEQYYNALIDAERVSIEGLNDSIEKCAVKTPVSGYVTEIPAEGLSTLSQGDIAAVIKAEGAAKIESYVSTQNIGEISVGGEVELVLKGRDADIVFEGIIESISKWAEVKSSSLGLDEKKVYVTIEAINAGELLPGYDVDVKYTVFKEENRLLVPTGAIFQIDGNDYVFTIDDNGKAKKTQIVKGVKTLTETVVESGLNAGDTVIVEANVKELKEGIRVK